MCNNILNMLVTDKELGVMFEDTIAKAIKHTGYKPGDPAGPVVQEIVSKITGSVPIEELWGPAWVITTVIVADRLSPILSPEETLSGAVYVTRNMKGYSHVVPEVFVPEGLGLKLSEMDFRNLHIAEKVKYYIAMALEVCELLDIPSPLDASRLYDVLGRDANQLLVETLWKTNPKRCRPDPGVIDGVIDLLSSNFERSVTNSVEIEVVKMV